jgi:DNA polymerase kappa
MATFVAKALCPHLIEVKNDMPSYVAASRDIMDALAAYDENMAQASLDEAYLDLTPYCAQYSMDVEQVVSQLRNEVLEKTGLTVSVGIAPNKMLAKICSDKNKPNGQYQLHPERQTIINFTRDLPVRKVPGIGRVTERILDAMNVKTCHDVWEARVMLYLTFDGKIDWLLQAHLGLASHVVQPSQRHERKSVGRETTFRPSSNQAELLGHLRGCCDQVEKDLERLEFDGRTITLIGKHDTYQRFSRAHTSTAGRHFKTADELFTVAKQQFDAEQKVAGALCLRLIGVRLTNLRDLKQAKEGGPLTKMLRSAQSKLKTSPWGMDVGSSSDEMLLGKADAALTEDEERRQIRLAMEASLREVQERDMPTGKEEIPSPAQDEDEVVCIQAESVQQNCPICQRVLSFRADMSEAQVDLCLSGFNDIESSQSKPASKARRLDQFVTRS